MNRCINLVYPMVTKRFTISNLGYSFTSIIIVSLIKINKIDLLLNQVIQTTKYYNQHPSNSNIIILGRFFNSVLATIHAYFKQEQFYIHLKNIISLINITKLPLFSLFLINCIKPFNRVTILNIISQSLKFLKYNAKQLILSRLYKQFVKFKNLSLNKRKYFMKKDVKYPSAYYLNLQQLRDKIDSSNYLNTFKGTFRQKIDSKLLKLGISCKIYSPIRRIHPINQIINHYILDSQNTQRVIEKWQAQQW